MRESDDGEKDEMYVATSESGLTCVCDKSWAGGRRGAQGPLRIKWGHRCSRPPSYNSTISQVQVYRQTIAPQYVVPGSCLDQGSGSISDL